MSINLGYACINMTLQKNEKITTNRGMIKRTFKAKGIKYASELAEINTRNLLPILMWNHKNNIKVFRMTSCLFPWASEYKMEDLPDWQQIEINLKINPDHFSNVVLASKGYPENYERGFEITGLNSVEDSIIFQAGTSLAENKTITSGGRVLSVVSRDDSLQGALKKSYSNIEKINFEGKTFRKDIGFDL